MKYCRKAGSAIRLMMIFWLILTMGQAALAADGETAIYYKLTEVQRGTVDGGVKVNVRKQPDVGADRLGGLDPDESCVITGEEGDWWQVEFEGKTGYVLKTLLEVSFSQEDEEVWIDEPLDAEITDLEAPRILQYRNEYELNGTIRSNIPMLSVSVEIYDERSMTVERSCEAPLRGEDRVRSYPLENLEDELSFHKLSPGEKTLIIRAADQSESIVVAEIPFYVYGEVYEDENGISINPYPDALSMTADCEIEVAHGRFSKMTDNNYRTDWNFESPDDQITITLPEEKIPEMLTVHWSVAPTQATIELLDADDQVISVIGDSNPGQMIHCSYPLDEATRRIRIRCADENMTILELRVYEQEKISKVVQQWEEMPEKVDMMVVSTHQDDEMLFFGGTIPYYAGEQEKDVAVVYMANCSRRRYAEALDGLWSCGLKTHPIFFNLRDARLESYQETVELWGEEATINMLVELFRRYKPEVVVTHDVNGEYGHPQHILTSACVQKAMERAGDPSCHPESAQQYGVWTPRKLYIHLYKENELIMSVYDEPMKEYGYMNMTDIATIGFTKHVSQDEFFSMDNHGVKYDNRKYGLAFTTVGEDVEKNDFFENID